MLTKVLLMCFTVTAALAADLAGVPPLVRVPPTPKPPTVDGKLEPGEWDHAFMGSGIAPINQGLDPIPVQYWFAWDAERVYLAGRMQTRPGENYAVPPRVLGGGGPGAHFEFLVDPNPGNPDKNWVQAMLYALGEVRNTGYSQRIGGYVPYEVAWDYADSWADGWWTVELSAPASALNRAETGAGKAWGILFAGQIRGTGVNYFAGTAGCRFNDRAGYTKMIMDPAAPVVRVTGIGDILGGRVAPALHVVNTTAGPLALRAEYTIADTDIQETRTATVAPGAAADLVADLPLPTAAKDRQQLTVRLTTGDTVLYEGAYALKAPRAELWPEIPAAPPAPPVIFEAVHYPYFGKVRAIVDFGGLADPGTVQAAEVALMAPDGRQLAEARATAFANRAADIVLDVGDLAEGDYTARVRVLAGNGGVLAEETDVIARRRHEFEHNTIGVSTDVLKPWTPIEVDAEAATIAVWGRQYVLAPTGLPARIVSAGEELLAAPVVIREGATAWVGDGVRFTEVAPDHVRAVATARGPGCRATVELYAEYDGMLKYTITVDGAKGADLAALDMDVRLPVARAGFIHAAGDGCRSNYSHALPAGEGRVWDATAVMNWTMPYAWLTYTWLGDHARGLCWWADSAAGWTLPRTTTEPAVEVYREGGVVRERFRLVARPAKVLWADREPRRIVFAFAATPVRPRAAWAQDIGLCPAEQTHQNWPRFDWVGWTGWAFKGKEKANYPNGYTFAHLRPVDPECEAALVEYTRQKEEAGRRTLVYTDMRCRSMIGPPEKDFAWEWTPDRTIHRKARIMNAPHNHAVAISSTQSRVDYDLWCLARGMDMGIDYWYFDEIQNEGQVNPVVGLGFQDEDGQWLPTMRLFQYRELWKRLYTLMQQRGQDEPIIVLHNTSTTYAGPMAFTTCTWDYEEANADPDQRQLTKFGIDYLVTESMGHQYGFVGSTLGPGGKFEPWLAQHVEEQESAERHWMGVHMLLQMNPYLTSAPAVREGLEVLGRFGWNQPDCEWIPYWRAPWTWTGADRTYVAGYRRGKQLLLVVLNDTPEEQTIVWHPGDLPAAAVDARAITVPRFDYRTVLVELR